MAQEAREGVGRRLQQQRQSLLPGCTGCGTVRLCAEATMGAAPTAALLLQSGDKQEPFEEGCLSFPNIYADVWVSARLFPCCAARRCAVGLAGAYAARRLRSALSTTYRTDPPALAPIASVPPAAAAPLQDQGAGAEPERQEGAAAAVGLPRPHLPARVRPPAGALGTALGTALCSAGARSQHCSALNSRSGGRLGWIVPQQAPFNPPASSCPRCPRCTRL